MLHRIWQEPGQSIKITCFVSDDPGVIAQASQALIGDGHIHPDAVYLDTPAIDTVLPPQRRFLDAMELVKGAVEINRAKAEAKVLADLRAVRDQALTASDMLILRAQDVAPANVPAIKVYRQALRDLPQTTDLTRLSLDALDAFTPVLPVQP